MNLGMPEMIFIFLIALLIFGPKKLPEIGRQVGKFMAEFRRASNEFKYQLEDEVRQLELSEAEKKRPQEVEEQRKAFESMGENTISLPQPTPAASELTKLGPPTEETVSTTIAQLHGSDFGVPQPVHNSVAPLPYELEDEAIAPQDQGANA